MKWYNLFINSTPKENEIPKQQQEYLSFSNQQFNTPFMNIGQGNLSQPYVKENIGGEKYIRFGADNLYAQLLNQLVYMSPLQASIVQYKANATIGGGWDLKSLTSTKSGRQTVSEYSFMTANNFPKMIRQLTKDIIVHSRCGFLITPKDKYVSIERIGPEKIRVNADKTIFSVSNDWSRGNTNVKCYPAYSPNMKEPSIFYWTIDEDCGQDHYPIPLWASAANWCALDGEIAYLQKNNILNGIFPSYMLTVAKLWQSDQELQKFKKTIENAKSSREAGRILTFAAQNADELPTLTPIPVNNNDKLFSESKDSIESNICRANQIDGLILGIRPSGKLGSGAELPMAYAIFEKNVVKPLRTQVEEVVNKLLFVGGIESTFVIKDYQIVENEIVNNTKFNTNN